MKSFRIPLLSSRGVAMSFLGLCLFSGLDGSSAQADFTFSEPVNVQSEFSLLDPMTDLTNCFSVDGLEMYFESPRSGGHGLMDLWVCKRAAVADAWGAPENLGPLINSATWDKHAFISADGLQLYFYSFRPGGYGQCDLYVTQRAARTSPWGLPTNLGPQVNGSSEDFFPSVSPDGLELYFTSVRTDGYGGWDMYVSKRATPNDPWGDPVNVGPAVNSPGQEGWVVFSPDWLLMFFWSDRPGGFSPWGDNYVARRASRSAPWQPAVNLGSVVNGPVWNAPLGMTADGSALYVFRDPGDGSTLIWKAPILPIVDFNADKKVDIADVFIMLEHWQTDYPLCDIGPYAWGDGIVDAKDLIVLAEHMANTPADGNAP